MLCRNWRWGCNCTRSWLTFFSVDEGGESCWHLLKLVKRRSFTVAFNARVAFVPCNKQLLNEVFVISRIIEVEVGVISRSRRLRLITLTETSIILNITKTESNNCFIIHSSLTPSSTKRANLTWLLLEITHRGHTWHDYSWPWHDYCIICKLWRHGRWFRKFTVGFRPIKKELESWMYNNSLNLTCLNVFYRQNSDCCRSQWMVCQVRTRSKLKCVIPIW